MSIQYPLEGAWSDSGEGIRTPRSARSTRTSSATSRPNSTYGDRLVITPAFDEPLPPPPSSEILYSKKL